jgi:glycosyltransferase involved in cell wall biosynthesis
MSLSKMPLFSVIIPAYNAELFIFAAVKSVTDQNYPQKEIIIIDDGSSDDTLCLAMEMAKSNPDIKVIKGLHQGVSASRNMGIKASSGDYILFLDSDDYLSVDTLPKLHKLVQEKSVDAVVFNGNVIINKMSYGLVNSGILIPTKEGVFTPDGFEGLPFIVNCYLCCYKGNLVRENNLSFDESLTHGEDWKFVNQYLCLCDKIGYVNRPFYNYTIHNESVSFITDSRCLNYFTAFTSCIEEFKKNGIWHYHQYNHYLKCILHFFWFYTNRLLPDGRNSDIKEKFMDKMHFFVKDLSLPFLYSLANHLSVYHKKILLELHSQHYAYIKIKKIERVAFVKRIIIVLFRFFPYFLVRKKIDDMGRQIDSSLTLRLFVKNYLFSKRRNIQTQ